MKKTVKLFVVVTAIVMLMAGTVVAAPANSNTNNNANLNNNSFNIAINNILPPIEESSQTGRISWENGIIEAVGTGLPPENSRSIAQSNALARRAAIVDAQRNLMEAIQGVQVDAETTMSNLSIDSDIVKTKVSGLLRGAKIIRQQSMPDGSYQVVMTINLYGDEGLAAVALPALKAEPIQVFPAPAPRYIPSVSNAFYTGVIVDARGFGLQATFSPRIYDETGTIVYGNRYIDTDFAISHGMVEYTITPEMVQAAEMGQSRAGLSPLIIKALRIVDNNCNVVISNADANAILSYNQTAGFLKNCAVVFER